MGLFGLVIMLVRKLLLFPQCPEIPIIQIPYQQLPGMMDMVLIGTLEQRHELTVQQPNGECSHT